MMKRKWGELRKMQRRAKREERDRKKEKKEKKERRAQSPVHSFGVNLTRQTERSQLKSEKKGRK